MFEELAVVRAPQGPRGNGATSVSIQGHGLLSGREDAAIATLQGPARATPIPKRRGAVYRLQALRGCVPRRMHQIESEARMVGTRRPTRYDIDLFKCIYCGFCEEACPVDAIVLTRIFEFHYEKRGDQIITKDGLLAIGDRMEAQIAADRAADAPYR